MSLDDLAGLVQGRVMKTKAFMEQHADLSSTCTNSGYNPLLEDFANTSFYLGYAGQSVSWFANHDM